MAFLDDLGKKITQVSQTAVQKTKDMTDIARINGMISDEEKKLTNNYYQIGRLYVAMHKSDYEADFAGMISAIVDSEAKIKNFKQQIQDIKGVARCEKCGAEVANNAPFCSACGAKMPVMAAAAANPNLIRCTGCGAMIDKTMRFCTSCGKPTADMAAPAQAEPTPAQEEPAPSPAEPTPVQEEPAVEANTVACPNCGASFEAGQAFCTQCGTKL